ncbi:MAG: hypothetical protein WD733_01565 [Bryobacterales bacterium]
MTAAILGGLLAGLSTIGISELLLKVWGSNPVAAVWKLTLLGIGLRTAWVLGVLTVVLVRGGPHRAAFISALFAGYLVAQVWEGFRYQRLMAAK